MSCFNEIEKSLKRYLKSKVTISVATIVGFMITGAIAFGDNQIDTDEFKAMQETSYGKQFSQGETTLTGVNVTGKDISNGRYMITVSSGAGLTIDKDSKISTAGVNKYILNITESSKVTNNGEIEFDEKNSGKVAVQLNGGGTTADKPATFTNNGSLKGKNILGSTIEMSGNTVLNNNGTIEGNIVGKNYNQENTNTQIVNLGKGSHIIGSIKLNGTGKNTINIDGLKNGTNSEIINIQSNKVAVNVNNSNVTLEGKIANSDGTAVTVNNKDGDNTLINNAVINAETGIGVSNEDQDTSSSAKDRVVTITNNGDITAKYYGIYNNGYYTKYNKIEINNTKNILVNDFAKSTAEGKPFYYSNGIYQASGTYTETAGIVRNSGEIKIELSDEQNSEIEKEYKNTKGDMFLNIHGVRLHEHSEGYNTGDIIVDAFGGNGVVLTATDTGVENNESFKTRYNYFENSGNISVTGENGIGVSLKNTTNIAKVEAVNDSTGVITVNGNNAIAVKVDGKNSEFKNMGTLVLGAEGTGKKAIVTDNGGTATSTGIIKVEGTELAGVTTKDEAIEKLFDGENIKVSGLIVDKDGNDLFASGDEVISDDTSGDVINIVAKENDGEIKLDASRENGITLTAGKEDIKTDAFNVVGGVVKVSGEDSVNIESDSINLDAKGKLAIDEDAQLNLSNGTLNKVGEDKTAVVLSKGATLTLNHMDIHGDITADENIGESQVNVAGETKFDGNINVKNINIGNVTTANLEDSTTKDNKLFLSSTTVVGTEAEKAMLGDTKNTITIGTNGQLVLEVGANGDTALSNSTGVTIKGTEAGLDENAAILLSIGNLSGEKVSVDLGKENGNTLSGSIGIENASEVYELTEDNEGIVLTYNKNLFAGDSRLNSINNGAVGVSNLFSTDKLVRSAQLTRILDGSIYSETAKASYNSIKLAEETLRGMDRIAEVGKWAAKGSVLYNKHTYDRAGYDSDIETSGLLGAMEYGLDNNTAVGVAFGGAYQDVDSATGNADGTTLYLGTYAKKVVGAYSLTAGVGYQYGNYDANNVTGSGSSSDTYDSNAVSTYVEGRYKIDLGDNVSFQPKAKLGYTYVKQDKAQDAYIGVSDAELSTFDTEIGADLVKTYALKDGKANLVFGASYVRAYGDTDKDFRGQFANSADKFNINGAMLSENTGKFDLTLEVAKDNGLFYNGGVNLNVGSDNTRDYGVRLGAGYRF